MNKTKVKSTGLKNIKRQVYIHQYVRDNRGRRKGQLRGVVVAHMYTNQVEKLPEVRIGWSFTNTKMGDHFKKDRGLNIAVGRTLEGTDKIIPHDVRKVIKGMLGRVSEYYHVPSNCIYVVGRPNADTEVTKQKMLAEKL